MNTVNFVFSTGGAVSQHIHWRGGPSDLWKRFRFTSDEFATNGV